jgi:N-acetylglucosamine kinase-like BadF-type ATPase
MLVVDSGSTKADWAFIDNTNKKLVTHTMGLNPYFHDAEKIYNELTKKEFTDIIPIAKITNLFFYGAGCPDDFFRNKMASGLSKVFNQAKIEVHHDLLGAARATCGHQSGIAGILGTGSNSCAYDGKNITDNVPALAHVLGDEGGGVHLGKLILQAYFYRELPPDLLEDFEKSYPEGKDDIIHRIYGEGQNVHIANFAQFLIRRKTHPYIKKLIQQSFREFANRHLKKYLGWQELKVNIVGSIGDLLREDLEEVLTQEQLTLGKVVRKPIDELVNYHFSERRL